MTSVLLKEEKDAEEEKAMHRQRQREELSSHKLWVIWSHGRWKRKGKIFPQALEGAF